MKVYRVHSDVKNYQILYPENEDLFLGEDLPLDCTPRLENWQPIDSYCHNPKKRLGDFYYMTAGTLIVHCRAVEIVLTFLEMAGELLPVIHGDETHSMLNVLECVNCLDRKKTEFRRDPDNDVIFGIEKYAFHQNRFPESSLFKIPETCTAEILTYESSMDPEEEFKACVETNNLEGLIFELIWDSEA